FGVNGVSITKLLNLTPRRSMTLYHPKTCTLEEWTGRNAHLRPKMSDTSMLCPRAEFSEQLTGHPLALKLGMHVKQINEPFASILAKPTICSLRSHTKTPPFPRRADHAEKSGGCGAQAAIWADE